MQQNLIAHGYCQTENQEEYTQHFRTLLKPSPPSAAAVEAADGRIRLEVAVFNSKHPKAPLPDGTADAMITALRDSGVKAGTVETLMNTPGKSISFTDRDKGIKNASDDCFPNGEAHACTHHIEGNVYTQCGKIPPSSIWKAQSCETEAAADAVFTEIGKSNKKAEAYLRNIDPKLWLAWPHRHTSSIRGVKTSNCAEGQNSVLTPEARHLNPLDGTLCVCGVAMSSLTKRRDSAFARLQQGHLLTEYAQALYDVQERESVFYNVTKSSATLYYVSRTIAAAKKTHTIDLEGLTCTGGNCASWFQDKVRQRAIVQCNCAMQPCV
jgi:hypothetical protein